MYDEFPNTEMFHIQSIYRLKLTCFITHACFMMNMYTIKYAHFTATYFNSEVKFSKRWATYVLEKASLKCDKVDLPYQHVQNENPNQVFI